MIRLRIKVIDWPRRALDLTDTPRPDCRDCDGVGGIPHDYGHPETGSTRAPNGSPATAGRSGTRFCCRFRARLHDARHTAATVLMLLGVPARGIGQIMGWEPGTSASVRARYLHVPDAMLKDVARKIADAIWGTTETSAVDKNQDNEG